MVKPNRMLAVFSFVVLSVGSRAQGSYAERARQYIATYKELAIAEQRRTGVPAAITLAQGIYETSAGASELATGANNHFGIKCKRDWTGATFAHTDDAPNECFRKYPSAGDSYRDHSDYLRKTPRYAALFRLAPADYVAWATELKRAGYATNPKYAQLLTRVVEDFGLQDYTYAALKTPSETVALFTPEVVPNKDASVATTPPPAPVAAPAPAGAASYMDYLNGLQGFYAKAGDMLLNAAMRYNVRYAKLLEWNDLHDAPLPFDQFIYLEKKSTRGARPMHVVREGETVLQVAQAEGIQLTSLRALNQLEDGEEPAVGSTLYLQGGAPIKPRTYRPQPATPVVAAAETPTTAASTVDGTIATTTAAHVADSAAPVVVAASTTEAPAVVTTPAAALTDADSVEVPAAVPTTNVSTDPLERLKARMDKAVYAPAKPRETPANTLPTKTAAPAPVVAPVTGPKTAGTKKGAQPAPTKAAVMPATGAVPTAAAPKTTVVAALPKPRKDTARPKVVVVPPPAGGARTVSAALPKDMQPTASPAASTAPAGNVEFHAVARGETVFSIAKRYGVTVTDLQTWNQLDFAAIRVGQQLRVKKP